MSEEVKVKPEGESIKDFILKVQVSIITLCLITILLISLINRSDILSLYLSFIVVKTNEIYTSALAVLTLSIIIMTFKSLTRLVAFLLKGISFILSTLIRLLSSFEGFRGHEIREIEFDFLNKLQKVKTKPKVEVETNFRKEEIKKIVTEENPQVTLQETFQRKKDYSKEMEEINGKLRFAFEKYGIDNVEITKYIKGPYLTRFYLDIGSHPVNKLTKINKELCIQLGQNDIMIDHSSEGLYLDIETPEELQEIVTFKDIHDEFDRTHHGSWDVPIGRTAIGQLQNISIIKSPHLLIAGVTESGKSVLVNILICGSIFGKSPEELQLVLIDPKRVEFAPYKDLPHLLTPVITDMEDALKSLA